MLTLILWAWAAEGHLKWEGKNGDPGAVPQWGPGVKPLVEVWGQTP